jgi:hypothetical protein
MGQCYDHNFLWQFLAKKLAFFSKTNVMIKNLHNLSLFWVKNANFFAEFLGENILKIITSSVPSLAHSLAQIVFSGHEIEGLQAGEDAGADVVGVEVDVLGPIRWIYGQTFIRNCQMKK